LSDIEEGKMKEFKPFLAPNQKVELKDISLPLLVSYKLDGIRCIFKDGQMFSRALKQFPNVQLRKRFEHLALLSKERDIILDGELLAKSITFNELSGLTRQLDHKLPADLYFYCFDVIKHKEFNRPFADRLSDMVELNDEKFTKILAQRYMTNHSAVELYFEEALKWGCDGLILRNPIGRYKFGRATVKENLIYKLKPFQTFDAKIIAVIQGTEVREGAEKKINELGNSVTSKKKDDRILINRACDFVVMYEGKELKVSIAMTNEEKEEVWKNRDNYIGKWIEYKGMKVGMKEDGLPRHPVFIRFRIDKDENS
jgi:DNA ligase-1